MKCMTGKSITQEHDAHYISVYNKIQWEDDIFIWSIGNTLFLNKIDLLSDFNWQ